MQVVYNSSYSFLFFILILLIFLLLSLPTIITIIFENLLQWAKSMVLTVAAFPCNVWQQVNISCRQLFSSVVVDGEEKPSLNQMVSPLYGQRELLWKKRLKATAFHISEKNESVLYRFVPRNMVRWSKGSSVDCAIVTDLGMEDTSPCFAVKRITRVAYFMTINEND